MPTNQVALCGHTWLEMHAHQRLAPAALPSTPGRLGLYANNATDPWPALETGDAVEGVKLLVSGLSLHRRCP